MIDDIKFQLFSTFIKKKILLTAFPHSGEECEQCKWEEPLDPPQKK